MMQFLRGSAFQKTYSGAGWAFSLLNSEVRGVQAAAYILALSSLASSILALFRDRLLAHLFGAGFELDIYYAAFRIPDLVFIGVGALVSAYILIPEITRRTDEDQKRYIDGILVGFSLLFLFVASIAWFFAPIILARTFPSLVGHDADLVFLTRILLLQAMFFGFSNIAAAITQSRHRYVLYAISPILYNAGIIFGALVLYPEYGLVGLVWGVVAGAALHVLVQIPSLLRDGFVRWPHSYTVRPFLATIRVSVARSLALSLGQLAFFGLIALAGTLSAGSISILMFAYNLQGVPLAIIGASYATAAFPTLAYAHTSGKPELFLSQMAIAARHILFWSLPAIALMIVLRAHIVRAVLGTGQFDWTDTRLTAAALAIFAVSLAAQGLVLLLIRACYAAGKTFAPFIISALVAAVTIILGVLYLRIVEFTDVSNFLESFLRVQDVVGTEVLVLAFAYSVASILGAVALILYFQLRFGVFFNELRRTWWESLTASLGAGLAAYIALHAIGDITLFSTLLEVLVKGAVAGFCGLFVAGLIYFLLKNREFSENATALRRRIWRDVEPVASTEQSA
jgi:putative peptidoglycan lipid II flippase